MAQRLATKVCMIGEAAVGKTRLIEKFVLDEYKDTYEQTLGSRVYKRRVAVTGPGDGTLEVELGIWDIMGQKGFRELLKDAYFYGAHGALAVCDVTRRGTLDDLRGWIGGLRDVTGPVPMAIVANKWDLADRKEVGEPDVAKFAKEFQASYFLTSAKTGANVEAAFLDLVKRTVAARPVARS